MAKRKTEDAQDGGQGGPEIIAGPIPRRPGEKRFQIRVKHPTFSGERCGCKFIEGRSETDSEQCAKDAIRIGYEVTDRDTGKISNALDGSAEVGRLGS